MSSELTIAGTGGRIEILVHGYENESALHVSDANWVSCTVSLAVGPFRGVIEASFSTHDFARFRDQLATALAALHGGAAFETDEDALSFRIDFGARGDATISGAVRVLEQARARLDFSFPSDQTFLRQTFVGVSGVCLAFPARDRPT